MECNVIWRVNWHQASATKERMMMKDMMMMTIANVWWWWWWWWQWDDDEYMMKMTMMLEKNRRVNWHLGLRWHQRYDDDEDIMMMMMMMTMMKIWWYCNDDHRWPLSVTTSTTTCSMNMTTNLKTMMHDIQSKVPSINITNYMTFVSSIHITDITLMPHQLTWL